MKKIAWLLFLALMGCSSAPTPKHPERACVETKDWRVCIYDAPGRLK